MTINQVQLSNTFNEFRQTVNNISNTVNAFTDTPAGPSGYSTQSIYATGLYSNTVQVSTLTDGRVVLAGANGEIVDDSGITYNRSSDRLTTTNATVATNLQVNGTVGITGVTTITGNTVFGSGANKTRVFAANGNIEVDGTIRSNDLHADTHIGSGTQELSVWVASRNDDQNIHKIYAIANTNGPTDMLVVNTNDGNNSYGEFIAVHHSGNTDQGWISMGINSTNYANGAYGITKAEDGYILYQPPAGTSKSGDLVIGTGGNGTGNKIIFSADGFDDPANNAQLVIHPGQKVVVNIPTQSSNTTTGALVVNGGIGLQGNLNIGGNVAITGTITLGGGGNTVSTSTLTVDNPMVFLGANNAADALDLGFVGTYTSSGTKYSGLVRDASDSGIYKLFNNISTLPSNTVNFASASYSTLQVGTLKAVDTTASSSKTTGALIVSGGAGIAGAVYATSFTANTGATISNFTTDGTFTGAANTAVPTAWAVKTYVDNNSGTESWQIKTANYTAVAGDNLFCDTTTGSFAITLPASPANNNRIKIADAAGTFGSRPLIVNHNGNKIQGTVQTLYLDLINTSVTLTYNTTYGWRII